MACKRFRLVMLAAFAIAVMGCDNAYPDTIVINPQFRGKWEITSFESTTKGTKYTLPALFEGEQLNSSGYEISEKSIKTYVNGVVVQTLDGIHTGDAGIPPDFPNYFYTLTHKIDFEMFVKGYTATIKKPDKTESCKKVSTFSWE